MSDATAVKAVLLDAFVRVRDSVHELTEGLTPEVAAYRPDPAANTVGWLVWHLTRVQDDHIADLLAGADPEGELASPTMFQVWPQWRDRFGLPFDPEATGYGQSPDDVGQVRVTGDLLAGYHADVHELTVQYLDRLTVEELGRVVDTRWDPPVTAAVRLVSVVGDTMQHGGQAAYVRGLAERRASNEGAQA